MRSDGRTKHENTITGVYRRARGGATFQRVYSADSIRSALYTCPPQTCIQKEVSRKSASKRTKAESHYFGLGPRFPRQGLIDRFCLSDLAGQFCVGDSLVHDVGNADLKPLCISHISQIESESLFIEVAKQMERLSALT